MLLLGLQRKDAFASMWLLVHMPPPNSPKKRGEEIQCCGLLGKYLYSQILVMIEGRPLSPRNVDPAPPRGSISLNFSRWARSLSMIWRHENVGPFLLNL